MKNEPIFRFFILMILQPFIVKEFVIGRSLGTGRRYRRARRAASQSARRDEVGPPRR